MSLVIRRDAISRFIKYWFVGIYFFTLACLYSEKHLLMYYLIMFGEFSVALLSVIFCKRKINKILNSKYMLWLFAVFIMYNIWGFLIKTHIEYPALYIITHMINTLTIVFITIDSDKKELEELFCKSSVIGSLLSIAFVVVNEQETLRQGIGERIGVSASGNVDVFGMYLGVMSIFTLYKFIIKKNRIYLFPYILQVCFMLLTGSKQALLYIIISYIMFIKYSYKTNLAKYIVPLMIAIIAVVAIFSIPVLYNLVGHRIEIMLVSFGVNIAGIESSRSTDVRMGMIVRAFELFLQNPIFGGGWGFFTKFSGFNMYSHATYTEILVTYGIFGFVLYYSRFYKDTFRLLNIKKREPVEQLAVVLMVSILVADFARITFSQTALNYVIVFFAWKILSLRNQISMQNKRGGY